MKRSQKWLIACVVSGCLLANIPAVAMAQKVTVTLPTFPVTFNNTQVNPLYDNYPAIVYNDIVYMPMTAYYYGYLGLSSTLIDNTWFIEKAIGTSPFLRWYQQKVPNKTQYTAETSEINVVFNGKAIDNSKEPYPLLHFRDTDYFPLTWHYVVEELGWRYSFDEENGLVIKSKTDLEINGKSKYYAMKDDVAVGYPDNTFEKYIFTVKKGDNEEKEFDLETQLQGWDYYFNKQCDENDYMSYELSPGPVIEGDILLLPSMRQHDGKKENVMIKIDYVQGKVISITAIEKDVN